MGARFEKLRPGTAVRRMRSTARILLRGRSRRGRERILCHVLAPAAGTDFVHDQGYHASDEEQRKEEDPEWKCDTVAADGGGFGRVDDSEHGDHVPAYGNILAELNKAEETDHVIADLGVVICGKRAKEIHDVVVCLGGDVDIAEEDDDVSMHFAFGLDAAEEADCVVGVDAGRDANVGEEMDIIGVRMGWHRGSRKSCA